MHPGMGYLGVADADAAAKRVTELGGTMIVPPQEIPEVGRFGVATDPQGARFALHTPAKKYAHGRGR